MPERVMEAAYDEGYRHFICGMANGCDLYFFDAARYLRLQHPEVTIEAAIPYSGQADRWRPELRERYAYDLRQCDYQTLVQETYTPGRHGPHARIRRPTPAGDHPDPDRPRAGRDMIYTKKHGERFFVLRVRFGDANRPRSL